MPATLAEKLRQAALFDNARRVRQLALNAADELERLISRAAPPPAEPLMQIGPPDEICPKCGAYVMASGESLAEWRRLCELAERASHQPSAPQPKACDCTTFCRFGAYPKSPPPLGVYCRELRAPDTTSAGI